MESFCLSFKDSEEGADIEFRMQLVKAKSIVDMDREYSDKIIEGAIGFAALKWVGTTECDLTLGEAGMKALNDHELPKIDLIRSKVAMLKIMNAKNGGDVVELLEDLIQKSHIAFLAVIFSINNVLFTRDGFDGLMELLQINVDKGNRDEHWYKLMCDSAKYVFQFNELVGCGEIRIWNKKSAKNLMKKSKAKFERVVPV